MKKPIHFKSGKNFEILTEHFDITNNINYVEFMLPDGRYIYYEFTKNHKIINKSIYNF